MHIIISQLPLCGNLCVEAQLPIIVDTANVLFTSVVPFLHSDLDLLRDAALTCEDPAQRWKCKQCGNRINTEEVENRFVIFCGSV